MLDCQHWWSEHDPPATQFTATTDPEDPAGLISLVTPQLVKILWAFRITVFFNEDRHQEHSMLFSIVRQLLGLPWDEAKIAICYLRTNTAPDTPDAHSPGGRPGGPGGGELAKEIYTILPSHFPKQFAETKREIACNLMHFVKETQDRWYSRHSSSDKEHLR
jgi:hypothetical protein